MLDTSIFSFSHNVFKRLLSLRCQKQKHGSGGKGLTYMYVSKAPHPIPTPNYFRFLRIESISIGTDELKFPEKVENILGKAINAGYHYFLLFQECFQTKFFDQHHENLQLYGEKLLGRAKEDVISIIMCIAIQTKNIMSIAIHVFLLSLLVPEEGIKPHFAITWLLYIQRFLTVTKIQCDEQYLLLL